MTENPNRIDYFEIGTPQPQQAREFYGGLFGWTVSEPSTPANYAMVDEGSGGLWDTTEIGAESWAIFYVHVADVRAAIEKAESLGARVAIPFTDNGVIEFAHLVDPLGNRFGVWRPKE
jgi:predicted enzyme related to lactoylglutathione lyase